MTNENINLKTRAQQGMIENLDRRMSLWAADLAYMNYLPLVQTTEQMFILPAHQRTLIGQCQFSNTIYLVEHLPSLL
jgi:hypothetical protein